MEDARPQGVGRVELEQLERHAVRAREVSLAEGALAEHVGGDRAGVSVVAPSPRDRAELVEPEHAGVPARRPVEVRHAIPTCAIAVIAIDAAAAESGPELGGRDVVGDHGLAEVDREDEAEAAAADEPDPLGGGRSRGPSSSEGSSQRARRKATRRISPSIDRAGRGSRPRAAASWASTAIPNVTASPSSTSV